jgi:hypothetical protein
VVNELNRLREPDWIALRLLYVLVASDPSSASLPDVQKALRYYNRKLRPKGSSKYPSGYVEHAFALLNKEIPYDTVTFGNPEVKLTRDVVPTVHYGRGSFEDAGSGYGLPEIVRREMEK